MPRGDSLPTCFIERADSHALERIGIMALNWHCWEAYAVLELLGRCSVPDCVDVQIVRSGAEWCCAM